MDCRRQRHGRLWMLSTETQLGKRSPTSIRSSVESNVIVTPISMTPVRVVGGVFASTDRSIATDRRTR
jgi:hypothetical protein